MKKYELRYSKFKSLKFSRLFKVVKKTFTNTSNIFVTTSISTRRRDRFKKLRE